jgi:hypothetical protein
MAITRQLPLGMPVIRNQPGIKPGIVVIGDKPAGDQFGWKDIGVIRQFLLK